MPVPNAIPRIDEEISILVDTYNDLTSFRLLTSLNEIIEAALANGDHVRASTARCEAFIAAAFFSDKDFERYRDDIEANLFSSDLEYLRKRSAATANLREKCRYRLGIAEITKRHDDKQMATRSLLAAITEAWTSSSGEQNQIAARFNLLVDLFPLAQQFALRCGMRREYVDAAIGFINAGSDGFVHAKTRVVNDITELTTRDQAARLRDAAIRLLERAAAGDPGEIIALGVSARRLASKLQEPDRPFLEAEAHGLETNLTFNAHPFRVQQVGSRLLRIYRLLGDDARAAATITRVREASNEIEYTTITVPFEDFDQSVAAWQTHARGLLEKHGIVGIFSFLALSAVFPTREQAERIIEDNREKGVGVFREIVTTLIADDERLLGQDPEGQEFDEAYGFVWNVSVAMTSTYIGEAAATGCLTLSSVFGVFASSWIGAPEAGGSERDFAVVQILMPGLRLYLRALSGDRSGIIPSLDSLVLHVETVIRKLALLSGIPHIKTTDRDGRPIQEYLGLELLDNPQMKALIGEDLSTFIAHTLKRAPEGLRDKIGHGILKADQYSMNDLHAVFLTLLRLAGLQLRIEYG
jgi:hypothetical protein